MTRLLGIVVAGAVAIGFSGYKATDIDISASDLLQVAIVAIAVLCAIGFLLS